MLHKKTLIQLTYVYDVIMCINVCVDTIYIYRKERERETGLQTLRQSVHAGCIHTEAMSLFMLDVYTKKQCRTTSAHVFPCERTRM